MSIGSVLIVSIFFSRPHSHFLFLTRVMPDPGPSGLVLALALRKNHMDVRIIDKEPGPTVVLAFLLVSLPLPACHIYFWPRSLELHKILGTFDDVANPNEERV